MCRCTCSAILRYYIPVGLQLFLHVIDERRCDRECATVFQNLDSESHQVWLVYALVSMI